MMKQAQILGLGLAAVGLAACGGGDSGRSSAKLSEIDWTEQVSGTTTVGHVEIGYEGDEVKDVTFRENGAPAGRLDFHYADGKVHTIDMTDVDGDRATYTWSYKDDRLSTIVWSAPQVVTYEQKFEYDDDAGGRARRVTSTTSWVGSDPSTTVETYDYDDEDRLEEISAVQGTSTWSSELHYDDHSRIERFTTYFGTDFTESDLSYDDDGRVAVVETSDDNRYEISYDDDGRIEEILLLAPTSGETLTVRYKYVDGDVDGLTFAPNLPIGGMIDLDGKPFSQADFTALAPPMLLGDVPAPVVESCTHDVCDVGAALGSSCDSCAASVCAQDSFCCSSSWDSTCVQTAESVCGVDCGGGGGGTCSHDVCTAGDALATSCDSCTSALCAADSYCCTSSWDSTCVGEVATYCGFSC